MDRHRVHHRVRLVSRPPLLRAQPRSGGVFQFARLALEDHNLHHLITKPMLKRGDLFAKLDPGHEVGGKRRRDVESRRSASPRTLALMVRTLSPSAML